MKLKIITQSMRLPFLILTPVCVFLGVSVVAMNQNTINLLLLSLTLIGALLAHISVNTLNEYFDFKSGLDLVTKRTKFSGGSGALPQHPDMAGAVLSTGIASLTATIVIGVIFIWLYGTAILPIGVAGIVLIITYTEWINKHPILCLISPGIGFGFLMVVGTQFVLTGDYTPLSFLIAVIPFFLVNNLLLLNQYPDIQADTNVGRKHFPITYGVNRSNFIYGLFALATIFTIIVYIFMGYLPSLSLIALLPMPLAFFSLQGAIKYGESIGNHPHYLAANVSTTILTLLLLVISIIAG